MQVRSSRRAAAIVARANGFVEGEPSGDRCSGGLTTFTQAQPRPICSQAKGKSVRAEASRA